MTVVVLLIWLGHLTSLDIQPDVYTFKTYDGCHSAKARLMESYDRRGKTIPHMMCIERELED